MRAIISAGMPQAAMIETASRCSSVGSNAGRPGPRFGVVGSRRRRDRGSVIAYIDSLPASAIVISGGAKGPDTWAAEAARARGLAVVEHLPDLAGVTSRHEATRRYYARNRLIAEDCDELVAFVAPDRRGGTENTIKHAIELGKPVTIL